MSPEDRVVSNVTDALEIVRELAARGPIQFPVSSGGGYCQTCPDVMSGPRTWASNGVPANHEPSCLWRRARELYPQPVVS